MSRIAFRRAALISVALLRSSASTPLSILVAVASGWLHSGQRFANPGLFGFSSNSSPHSTQILMGKGIYGSSIQRCASHTVFLCFTRDARPQGLDSLTNRVALREQRTLWITRNLLTQIPDHMEGLSSRPERSVAEGPAPSPISGAELLSRQTLYGFSQQLRRAPQFLIPRQAIRTEP